MDKRTVNGANISYHDQGRGSPLVLIHGFPLDSRIFDAQLATLSERYRVIVPDLRGFGQSASSDAFTIASLADDVHALLEEIGALPCALGGLSMGGYVALAFAKKYPGDLAALILIDTRAEADLPDARLARDKMIELARAGGATAVADQMLPKMLAAQTLKSDPEVTHRLTRIMRETSALTIEHALAAMRDRADYSDLLLGIQVPALIVVGEADAITPPRIARDMRSKIPRAQLVQLTGAGHLTTMEQPGEVSTAMNEFLKLISF